METACVLILISIRINRIFLYSHLNTGLVLNTRTKYNITRDDTSGDFY